MVNATGASTRWPRARSISPAIRPLVGFITRIAGCSARSALLGLQAYPQPSSGTSQVVVGSPNRDNSRISVLRRNEPGWHTLGQHWELSLTPTRWERVQFIHTPGRPPTLARVSQPTCRLHRNHLP